MGARSRGRLGASGLSSSIKSAAVKFLNTFHQGWCAVRKSLPRAADSGRYTDEVSVACLRCSYHDRCVHEHVKALQGDLVLVERCEKTVGRRPNSQVRTASPRCHLLQPSALQAHLSLAVIWQALLRVQLTANSAASTVIAASTACAPGQKIVLL